MLEKSHNLIALLVAILLTVTGVGMVQAQGPIPPPGPPGPTMKSLQEIYDASKIPGTPLGKSDMPYTILFPGRYFLTENLSFRSGSNLITINSDDVVLDLNGFKLIGFLGDPTAPNGIVAANGIRRNITIRNGILSDWPVAGVDLTAASSTNFRIENLHVSRCGVSGIVTGHNSLVSGCVTESNGDVSSGFGISVGVGSIVENCTARSNNGGGIFTDEGSLVSKSTAYENVGRGITISEGSSVVNSIATRNTNHGIAAQDGGTIIGCVASRNQDDGINADGGALVLNCSADRNNDNGIELGSNSTVKNSRCRQNDNDGNGDGAGIKASGDNNRIEGNQVTGNAQGIDVDLRDGNIVIKNSASGNTTNYLPGTGNTIGPMITAAGTIAQTNPWANFDL